MEVTVKLSHLRIAPRKVRLLADLVRGKKVKEAQLILSFAIKRGASPLLKLLNQAIDSALNNFQANPDNLYIAQIMVNEGATYKRWRPRARGQAYQIQKKTSHIILTLKESVSGKKSQKVKKEVKSVSPEKVEKIEKVVKTKPRAIKKEELKGKTVRGSKQFFRRKSV